LTTFAVARAGRIDFNDWRIKCGTAFRGHCYRKMSDFHPNALVMIVDDDVFERMGASCMFSDAGYRVLEAVSADEALQFLESIPDVRLIFTDVSMPGSMSGAALAHRVAERWPGIGIIITSGRPRPEPLPLGAQFHAKPYEPTNVLQHARDIVPLG
jgi:two-component system, response regulator PdtaR